MTTVVPGGILAVGRRHQPKHETNDVLNSEGGRDAAEMQKKSGGSSRSIRSATTTIAAGSRFGMTDDDESIEARTRANGVSF